ncbi:MAG: DUF3047 domain-containing protein [Nitrospinota bacterium]
MPSVRLTLAGIALSSLLFSSPPATPQDTTNPSDHAGKTVKLADFTPAQALNGQPALPRGWTLKVWQGQPDVQLLGENGENVLRLRSDKTAVSIYREAKLDLNRHPILSWKWKVTQIPPEGDARVQNRDDQAAGLYVIFPRFPTFVNSQLIGYIWDSNVPAGTVLQSKKNALVHYIVVRSGSQDLNQWITEERNVLEDYRRVFGQNPPDVGGISVMIDTDDTRAAAESYFAKIEFSETSAANLQPPPNRFVKFQQPELVLPK